MDRKELRRRRVALLDVARHLLRELRRRPKLLALYLEKHPGKEAEWRRNEAYISAISPWGQAIGRGDWDRAERIWNGLPKWVKERYLAGHPDSKMGSARRGGGGAVQYQGQFFRSKESRDRFVQGAAYFGWVQRWAKTFEAPAGESMKFFWTMPEWVRERYFAKHPDKRVEFEANLRFGKELAEYFAGDDREGYLKAHPDLAKWLASRVSSKSLERAAILAAYRNIPSDEGWLKRVFREKYPEIFSQEAKGEARLRKVYDKLAAHPEMSVSFERWRDAIWASYEEMLRHDPRSRPKQLEVERVFRKAGLSAAETSR